MQIEYQEKSNRRYMILTTEGMQVDDYQIHMMQENQIRGLLECRLKKIDDRNCYVYEVTGMHSLEETFEYRKITAEDLKNLLGDLSELFVEISAYLLKESSILLGAEYIYTDMEEKRFYFCCCPENENNLSDGLRKLGEYILPRLDHSDRQAVALGYDFYQKAVDGRTPEELFTNLLQADVAEEESIFEEDLERKELLDHFFTDDEEEDEKDDWKFTRGMSVLWALVTLFLAAGASVAGCFFGFLQVGLAAGIIIIALSIWIYLKKKDQWRKEEDFDGGLPSYETGFLEFEEENEEKSESDGREGKTGKKRENRTIENRKSGDRKRKGKGQTENPINIREQRVVEENNIWNGSERHDSENERENFRIKELKNQENQSRVSQLGGEWTNKRTSSEWTNNNRINSEWTSSEWDKETVLLARLPDEISTKKITAKLLFENIDHEEVILDQQVYFLGKSQAAADIVLISQSVSRIHARLDRTDEGYQIFDLSSRNGTYVNGKKLEVGQSVTLADGDHIRLGDIELRSSLQL